MISCTEWSASSLWGGGGGRGGGGGGGTPAITRSECIVVILLGAEQSAMWSNLLDCFKIMTICHGILTFWYLLHR